MDKCNRTKLRRRINYDQHHVSFLYNSEVEKHNLNLPFTFVRPDQYRDAAITKCNWRQNLVIENRQWYHRAGHSCWTSPLDSFSHKGGFKCKRPWISTTDAPEEFLKNRLINSKWPKELQSSLPCTLYKQEQKSSSSLTRTHYFRYWNPGL